MRSISMNNRDILELCFGNLRRRKTRTILSIIGVVIGTAAIVVMLSLGIGLSESFQQQIESYGNLHLINVYNWGGGGSSSASKLDDKTLAEIEKLDGATCVSPQESVYVTMGSGHMVASTQIMGMKTEMYELLGLEIEQGRMVNAADKDGIVFGKGVAAQFYDPKKQMNPNWGSLEPAVDPLGKFIITNDYNYGTNDEGQHMGDVKIVTIEARGLGLLANEYDEYCYNTYTSIEFAREIKTQFARANGESVTSPGQKVYDQVLIYAEDISKITGICDALRENYGFSTHSLNDMLEQMKKTAATIQAVLGGIGAISLLVAAIGIANTMIMSVYERTGEISVMKVIGASLTDIRKIFLIEAGMIGFFGGIAGVGLSLAISKLMNTVLVGVMSQFMGGGDTVSVIPVWLCVAAVAFAGLIGIISGYSPANRAMNMSVLEGLKNE